MNQQLCKEKHPHAVVAERKKSVYFCICEFDLNYDYHVSFLLVKIPILQCTRMQ